MVSDSELSARLVQVLRTSDLNTTTTAILRRKLEEEFGTDLSDKKLFIRQQVDLFLQTQVDKIQQGEKKEEQEEKVEDGPRDDEEEQQEVEEDAEDDEKPKVVPDSEEVSAEEEEEEEEEEEPEAAENSNGKRKRKAAPNTTNKDVKKRGSGGFAKPCSLSPQLQKLVGVPELARTEVVKQIWVYIRKNNLQDPSNKRIIVCDETLHNIFRVDRINMFQMSKALTKHIWPLETDDGKSTQKEKRQSEEKRKGGPSGLLALHPISDALVKFIGTGESVLSRSDAVKRMWEYIKQNNLQDPTNKKTILCDDKLKELFQVDSFVGFTMSKLLSPHFIKSDR